MRKCRISLHELMLTQTQYDYLDRGRLPEAHHNMSLIHESRYATEIDGHKVACNQSAHIGIEREGYIRLNLQPSFESSGS